MSALTLVLAGKARIGWVGAGVMGCHMCGHLVAKGFKTTVFSRTISKAEPLRLLGATLADSVAEVFNYPKFLSQL
jgi:3-hydroxyisobutyrate dehydrogenase-like beta-hydroxyacid dehydrogenase